MSDRAKVTSLEAIEAFRARLIIYRERAGRLLDEVADDVTRTRLWLQNERPAYWQNEIKRRHQKLEQAQQELFSAQLSGLREASYVQQAAVQKAKASIRDAEARLDVVKHWNRQFDHRVEPLARQAEKLRHNLGHDLGEAVASLAETIKTLAAYAELSPASGTGAPPKPPPDNPPAA
ncbi:MAG TPA: hypothetical protein PKA41_05405 [Verrucomicrobiota bacterium]|nr:hypothetical protein [Verrucomicrobiota bacterium]